MPAKSATKVKGEGLDRLPSGRIRARYRDSDGKQYSEVFASVAEAKAWRHGQMQAVRKGAHVAPNDRTTVRDYAEVWRAAQPHRAGTAALYERLLRLHVYPVLGDLRLDSVVETTAKGFLAGLTGKGLAPATRRQVHAVTRTIFRAAVADRRISVSPFQGIKISRVPRAKVEVLTAEQVHALVEAAPERYRAAILLAACSGMRQGEVLGLTEQHLYFLRREVHVVQQMTYLPGSGPVLGPLKTDREGDEGGVRTIPLPQVALDALALHMATYPPGERGLIFTRPDGQPVIRTSFHGGVWRPTLERAGLPPATHFHHLRHTYASVLIKAGESVKVVQERMGHRTAAMTLDTYTHLWEGDDERTRSVVDAAFAAPVSPPVSRREGQAL